MKKSSEVEIQSSLGAGAPDPGVPTALRELLDHLDRCHEAMVREAAARAVGAARAVSAPAGRFGVH